MSTHTRGLAWVLFLCLLPGFVSLASAGTTGEIKGKITDQESGEPMANAIVRVNSPNMIAQDVAGVTNEKGFYYISALSPGQYVVTAEFVGYHTATRTGVTVYLDSTTTTNFSMVPATAIDLVEDVVAELPAVDPEETQTKEILDQNLLEHVPMRGRSYQNYLELVPGVIGGDVINENGQTMIHGARFRNTGYMVDGIDTTDPMTGTFGVNFNNDAVQQIEVLTAGFEAEYGNYQGGIANLITKSGGNVYEGSFSYYWQTSALDGGEQDFRRHIPTLSVGGPVLKDKMWFFASVEYDRLHLAFPGMPEDWKPRAELDRWTTQYLLKTTWQVNPNHKLVIQYSADPYEMDNAFQQRNIPPDTNQDWQQGGYAASIRETSVFTNNVFLETMVAAAEVDIDTNDLWPYNRLMDLWPPTFDIGTGVYGGPYFRNGEHITRTRYSLKQDLSVHADTMGFGSHDVKMGYNFWRVDIRDIEIIRDLVQVNGSSPGDVYAWRGAGAGVYNDANNIGLYFQDRWTPAAGLTLNLGLRYDVSNLVEDNNISPRIGVAWDPFNEGKTVLRASWSRFYDTLYLEAYLWDKWIPLTYQYNFEDPERRSAADLKILDDNIEVPFTDEWTVGVEQEILPELSLSIRYLRRNGQAQLQDIEYNSRNLDGVPATWPEWYNVFFLSNANESRYEAVEAVFKKRLSRNWEILGSYTWSRSLGSSIDHAEPDSNDPRRILTEYGYLPYDFRHLARISGVVYIGNFTISGIGTYRSGTPYSVEVFPPFAAEGFFLGGRNSNRLGDLFNVDLAVERDFRISDYVVSLRVEGFNIFNSDDVSDVYEASSRLFRENGRRFGRRWQLGFKFNF